MNCNLTSSRVVAGESHVLVEFLQANRFENRQKKMDVPQAKASPGSECVIDEKLEPGFDCSKAVYTIPVNKATSPGMTSVCCISKLFRFPCISVADIQHDGWN